MTQTHARPLEPFGVQLQAAELRGDPAVLAATLREHDLIVVRGLDLSADEQVALMQDAFGQVTSERWHLISNDPDQGVLGNAELSFHADTFFGAVPYRMIALYGLDVIADETSTLFASPVRALQALPAALRCRLERLTVQNTFLGPAGPAADADGGNPANPGVLRPAIWRDPFSGKPLLATSASHSCGFAGVPEAEGLSLLREAFQTLYAPQNIYEHRWRNGDLVIWNNYTLQHGRRDISHSDRRTLRRVTVAEKTALEMYPGLDPAGFKMGHPRSQAEAAARG